MIQPNQMLSLPLSGLFLGGVNSLFYARSFGWNTALLIGVVFGVLLTWLASYLAYRSDCAARHTVGANVLFVLTIGPILAGANLMFSQMAGLSDHWALSAWTLGVATTTLPVIIPAYSTYKHLLSQGERGQWIRTNVNLQKRSLASDAFFPWTPTPPTPPRISAWQIGALSANAPLVWRLLGGGDMGLLSLTILVLSSTMVWVSVMYVGPTLGKAFFVLSVEKRVGHRLTSPHFEEAQNVRRDHWLARWFMSKT